MKRLFVMFNQVLTCLLTALLAFGPWQYALAAPDDFVDDSSIYIGTPSVRPKPNVLILIDTSNATLNVASGNAYDPTFTYPVVNGVDPWDIYSGDNQGDFNRIVVNNDTNALENLTSDACANIIRTTLLNAGTYSGSGTNAAPNIRNGNCDTGPSGAVYALGNYLNYLGYTVTDIADVDGDTVPDDSDICDGHDDRVNSDSDGIPDGCDNCPVVANASQDDGDGDTVGDACDRCPNANDKTDANSNGTPDCLEPSDFDGDGVVDNVDNCPPQLCIDRGLAAIACANPDQQNDDALLDPFGNVCDQCNNKDDRLVTMPGCNDASLPDADADGVPDPSDNCPSLANPTQTNTDNDTNGGDACDSWPTCANHGDFDADGKPDACGHTCNCGTVIDLCEGNDALGDPDANGLCGDQCTAPYPHVIVTYGSGVNAGNRYLLVAGQSHTSAVDNRPDKNTGHWSALGAGDGRTANFGAWAGDKCYVHPDVWCNWAKPNKNGCDPAVPAASPVAGGPAVPADLLIAAMPAASAAVAALLALDAWLTPSAAAAPPPVGTATETQRKIMYDAITQVATNARYAVNFGAVTYASNQKGAHVLADVASLSSDAALSAFIAAVPGPRAEDGWPTIPSNSVRPLSSALYDAGYYFGAQYGNVSIENRIPNGIINQCGYNHIIVITNGLPNNDAANPMPATIRDADGDGYGDEASGGSAAYGLGDHYLDDVAHYLYNKVQDGKPLGIKTHTVLAFQPSDPLVENTAADGHGKFYNAYDAQELANALTKLLTSIILDADTAFVAPVVPASTTNRTISSDRVYLGLFKPQLEQPWLGNVKKYRVGNGDQLMDSQGAAATNAATGEFITASRSYWGKTTHPTTGVEVFKCFDGYRDLSAGDGGIVGCGGLGGSLSARNLVSDPRKIYTYVPTSSSTTLTHADNAFGTDNAKLTPAMLYAPDASQRSRVIRFVQGFDPDSVVTNAQRSWLLGDILHAKPLAFNYTNYPGTAEGTCPSGGAEWPSDIASETFNSSILFVGANDGMLHAFRDCDGRELWGFIPPELLKDLRRLMSEGHYYFVDSSPVSYVHDANNDNVIDGNAGDKVLLIFGLRRGGSSNDLADAGPWGGYYCLDVTNPAAPLFLGKITNQTANVGMLGETWSQPRLAKIMDGSAVKVVAFLAGGYDKNEDLRFGATQTFPDTTDDVPGDTTIVDAQYDDGGLLSGAGKNSPGTSSQYYPDSTHLRGRGIYAVEIAELQLSGGVYTPYFNNIGAVLWHYDHADNGSIDFSIPSDLTVATDNNNFAQKIYVGDTGGRMWRFNVSSSTIGSWAGNIIFDANSGTGSDVGRKFFYRPAVAYVNGLSLLWFGSGDRAHPLNHDVVDRMYMLVDRGQITSDGISETRMTDLTLNPLQDGDPTNDAEVLCKLGKLTGTDCASFTLNPPYYGWYVKLNWDYDTNDDGDTDGNGGAASDVVGEKMLASAVMFNREAFYTTYSPFPDPTVNDPCQAGNLGTSRLYHMNFETGESVYNYDVGNDTTDVSNDPRASVIADAVLLRSDRMRTLGEGIPSGIVTLIDASGNVTMMISTSNRVDTYNAPDVRLISPVYWINW